MVSGGFRTDLFRLEAVYGPAGGKAIHTAATGSVTARIETSGALHMENFLRVARFTE